VLFSLAQGVLADHWNKRYWLRPCVWHAMAATCMWVSNK